MRTLATIAAIVVLAFLALTLRAEGEKDLLAGMPMPEFDAHGGLLRPEGFEDWMFVGTSMGLDYSTGPKTDEPGDFHNAYVQRQAFEYFKHKGEFPEGTVFVLTNSPPIQKEGPDSINQRGHFAGQPTGLEVSVKDSKRYDVAWAYFLFKTEGPRRASKALPQATCYDCHAEHAKVDNVFTQFYSVLDAITTKQEKK